MMVVSDEDDGFKSLEAKRSKEDENNVLFGVRRGETLD